MGRRKIDWTNTKLVKEIFLSKTNKTSSGCFEWTGSISNNGYGCLKINGVTKSAHRTSYQLFRGPISDNKIKVLHSCDNMICVNPSHLFLGTQDDNMKDMARKHRGRGLSRLNNGSDCPLALFNNEQVLEIRKKYSDGGTSTLKLAKEYGTSCTTIWKIVNFITYKNLTTNIK